MRALGIIAGGGLLPILVARRARAEGRNLHIVGINGEAGSAIEDFGHTWVEWGQIGHILKALKRHDCHQVVIAGTVTRPELRRMRLDFGAIGALVTIFALMSGGDDSVLSRVVRFFESRGFSVVGAHEIAPDLLAGEGALGRNNPGKADLGDIAKGWELLEALGAYDVGQAAVVARGYVLAVEAAEGTDAMLERCAGLRQWTTSRKGVLVKRAKPDQELRVDMPVIGPKTIAGVAGAGLAGVAIASDAVMIVDREAVIAEADRLGVFVCGVAAGEVSGRR